MDWLSIVLKYLPSLLAMIADAVRSHPKAESEEMQAHLSKLDQAHEILKA